MSSLYIFRHFRPADIGKQVPQFHWTYCMTDDEVGHVSERPEQRRQLFDDIAGPLPSTYQSLAGLNLLLEAKDWERAAVLGHLGPWRVWMVVSGVSACLIGIPVGCSSSLKTLCLV
jgi:hypothetical protein